MALILDGGATPIGLESTIVDATSETPRLLRLGGLARAGIEGVLGTPLADPVHDPQGQPMAPGMLASHYAPRAFLRLDAFATTPGEALLAFGPPLSKHQGPIANLSSAGDLREAAANLFSALRTLDAQGVHTIAVMAIPDHGLGEAINDRLRRAAAPRQP